MNSIIRYEKLLTSHMIAKFMASAYNAALDVCGLKDPERLEYVDCLIVRNQVVTEGPSGKHSTFSKNRWVWRRQPSFELSCMYRYIRPSHRKPRCTNACPSIHAAFRFQEEFKMGRFRKFTNNDGYTGVFCVLHPPSHLQAYKVAMK